MISLKQHCESFKGNSYMRECVKIGFLIRDLVCASRVQRIKGPINDDRGDNYHAHTHVQSSLRSLAAFP